MKLSQVIGYVAEKHGDQKYGDDPYICHLLDVCINTKKLYGIVGNEEEILFVALLHDVLEDTDTTAQELLDFGFSSEVVKSVELITKDSGIHYEDYRQRLIDSGDVMAIKVKFADSYSNYLGDKSHMTEARADKLRKKYAKNMLELSIWMEENGVKNDD